MRRSFKDPSTYRELQVEPSICKIIVIIILNRLRDWYDIQLLDQQEGLRRGRKAADGICVAKRLQKYLKRSKNFTMLY